MPSKSHDFTPNTRHENDADFWRGVVDGDGSIEVKKTGQIAISLVGSLPCVSAFAEWCRKISPTKATVRKHKSIYRFQVVGVYSMPILDALYADAPIALERKRLIYNGARGIFLRMVTRALGDHPTLFNWSVQC